ncbi:hypothetical protein Pcinc_013192 [Petrolisthes cinctipes]|uniref:Uncharacterized protein n=1 Tax=Petrolisthes cinctipes TaxID=88211 RepID=A0AAE1FXB2_PETCI|nr:hypothetical protein Pcinc_013192 [Petrolisthes cinctipes]
MERREGSLRNHHQELGFPDPLRPNDAHSGLTTHVRADTLGGTHTGRFRTASRSDYGDLLPSPRGRDDGGTTQHSMGVGAVRMATSAASRGAVGAMVMVYGSAEVCARTQCGLVFMPGNPPKDR